VDSVVLAILVCIKCCVYCVVGMCYSLKANVGGYFVPDLFVSLKWTVMYELVVPVVLLVGGNIL